MRKVPRPFKMPWGKGMVSARIMREGLADLR